MTSMFDLSGKVAVVAGASSGLGADAARAYAEHGADACAAACITANRACTRPRCARDPADTPHDGFALTSNVSFVTENY